MDAEIERVARHIGMCAAFSVIYGQEYFLDAQKDVRRDLGDCPRFDEMRDWFRHRTWSVCPVKNCRWCGYKEGDDILT